MVPFIADWGPLMFKDTIPPRFTLLIGTAKSLVYIANQLDDPFPTLLKF
jgi:hypothetical protein